MNATVRSLEAHLRRVPLARPWGSDVTDVGVIGTTVIDSDGDVGFGFSWTPSIGAEAVLAMLTHDITRFATGRPADPSGWEELWRHLHEAGGGGVTTIAIAGLDLALWDLRARRANLGLPELLGRHHDSQPVYGSGVNLHYSDAELVAQVERWVAAGYQAVKIKVGRPDLAQDVARVAAVREVLGADRALMIDANQRWNLEQATAAVQALRQYDLEWLEEPFRAEDVASHAELRRRTGVRIAAGENLHTRYRFAEYIEAGAVDVIQPNVIRVGGITPFLQIAELARDRGVTLAPHLLPELSAQIAFSLPEVTWVEDVEDAGFADLGALTAPTGIRVTDGRVRGGPDLGLGIRFGADLTTAPQIEERV